MSKTLQMRRGTTTKHLIFTGAEGELTVDTTKQTAVIHNGINAGGTPLAREDLGNVSESIIDAKGFVKKDLSNLDLGNIRNIARNDLSNVEAGAFLQFELAKNDLVSAVQATEDAQGAITLANRDEAIAGQNKDKAITPYGMRVYTNSFFNSNPELKPALPPMFIQGLLPVMSVVNPENEIIIQAGVCRDTTNQIDMKISEALSKSLVQNWGEGLEAGGMPSNLSLQANTTYHMFIIAKEDGETDAGFDTSIMAKNLLAETEAGELGYQYYRRVFSFLTDNSSEIIPFISSENRGGDVFIEYKDTILDFTDNNYTGSQNIPLSIPNIDDLYVNIRISAYRPDSSACYISAVSPGINSGVGNINGAFTNQHIVASENLWMKAIDREIKYINNGVNPRDLNVILFGYIDARN